MLRAQSFFFYFFKSYLQFYPSRKALFIKTHAFIIIINFNSFFTNLNINWQQRQNYLNEQFTYSLLSVSLSFSFLFLFLQFFLCSFFSFFQFFFVGLFLFFFFRWDFSKFFLARLLSAIFFLSLATLWIFYPGSKPYHERHAWLKAPNHIMLYSCIIHIHLHALAES